MQISNSYDYQSNPATKDSPWIRNTFIVIAVLFMVLMLVIPLLAVFYEAFKSGWQLYIASLVDPDVSIGHQADIDHGGYCITDQHGIGYRYRMASDALSV